MIFKPDLSWQTQEVTLSSKNRKVNHPKVTFNNIGIVLTHCQKHLAENSNFNKYIHEKIAKANKGIGIIRRLFSIFFRNALFAIYKSSVRSQIDYCDIVYDQTNNDIFSNNFQYNAALYITGAIKDVFVPSSKLR